MYFGSRFELGKTLASNIIHLKGQEPVVLALEEDSLVAASVASEVCGLVYPVIYEQIMLPSDDRVLGVVNQDGKLCYNPSLSIYHRQDIEINNFVYIKEASREAYKRVNRRIIEYGDIDKNVMTGRPVIIVGGVVCNLLALSAVFELLKTVVVADVIGLFGNISPDVSATAHKQCSSYTFLNIVPNLRESSHYFDEARI